MNWGESLTFSGNHGFPVRARVELPCTLAAAWDLCKRIDDLLALLPAVEEVEGSADHAVAKAAGVLEGLPRSGRVELDVFDRKMLTCVKAEGKIEPLSDGDNGSANGTRSTPLRLYLDLRPGSEPGHIAFICSAYFGGQEGLDATYSEALQTKTPELVEAFRASLEAALAGNSDRQRDGTLWRRLFSWVQAPEGTSE